jgi:hypothetical protein
MNEQLQKELAAWLGKLREAADAGGSFVMEQAPLIVQEKVTYGRVMEPILLVAVLLGAVFCVWAFRKGWHYEKSDYMDDFGGVICIVSAIGCAIFTIVSTVQAHNVAKAWFAPRLYVLEWLAELLK